jgi:hypothetical protein
MEVPMHLRFWSVAAVLLGLALVPGIGMAQSPGTGGANNEHANQPVQQPGSPQGDTQPAGSEPPHANAGPTSDGTPHGPIGAGAQTMPAKFDEAVAARDRIPIMARPLPLSDDQRRQIYDRVMEDAQAPVAQASAQPATVLPDAVTLNTLPSGLEDQIPAIRGYKYVKLQDKVLLVSPANRVVVGEIQR